MLDTAMEAARKAGRFLMESRQGRLKIRSKGLRDIVTDADAVAQQIIYETIRSRFPNHDFLGEEETNGFRRDSEYLWIVDPLDGTTNYARGLPFFAVSVGLTHQKEPFLGVVYDPSRDLLFAAERGKGASLNGMPIQVSTRDRLIDAIVAADWAREQNPREATARTVAAIAPRVGTFRSIGVASLGFCLVAAGWIEAYFHYSLYPWDAAAGVVIALEAGARCTDLRNRPWQLNTPRCLVSNGLIHEKILDLAAPYALV